MHGHAARVPRRARGDGARRLGPRGLRRADPRGRRARVSSTRSTSTSRTSRSRSTTSRRSRGRPRRAGLPLRCHADQLGPSGAAEAAVALGARSADHLNHVSAAGDRGARRRPGDRRRPAADVDVVPARVAARRASPPRRRRGGRDRDRLQPGHLAGALDARGDRDGVLALRARARSRRSPPRRSTPPRRSGSRRSAVPLRPGRPADLVVLDGRRLPAGAVPAGPQPGGPDVRRRRRGSEDVEGGSRLVLVARSSRARPGSRPPPQTGVTITLSASSDTIDVRRGGEALGHVVGRASPVATVEIVDAAGTGRRGDHRRGRGVLGDDRARGDRQLPRACSVTRRATGDRRGPRRRVGPDVAGPAVRRRDRPGHVEPARPGERVDVALTRGGRTVERRTVAMGAGGVPRDVHDPDRPAPTARRRRSRPPDLAEGRRDDRRRRRHRSPASPSGSPAPSSSCSSRGWSSCTTGSRRRRTAGTTPEPPTPSSRSTRCSAWSASFTVNEATWRSARRPDQAACTERLERLPLRGRPDEAGPLHGGGRRRHERAARLDRCRRRDARRQVPRLGEDSPASARTASTTRATSTAYRALHGWTEIPTYAASHGCVRIPYWNAQWVYGLADYGTRVVIYH